MNLDWNALEVVTDIIQFVLTGAVAALAFTWRRSRAAIDELKATDESHALQLDDQDTRITIMEQKLGAMPTHGDLGGVAKRLDQLHGDVRELTAEVRALKERFPSIERSLELVQQYLLKAPVA